MRGRSMAGRLRLESAELESNELVPWVNRGVAYARSLPEKS